MRRLICALLLLGVWACHPWQRLDVEHLSSSDTTRLQATLRHLDPLIAARKQAGTANLLTWNELYQPLPDDDRAFLNAFRALRAETLGATSHYFGEADLTTTHLIGINGQTIIKDGLHISIEQQHLHANAYFAYREMMRAMERDLGTTLRIESGYRSSAYQLYLFLFYVPKHGYSIRETNRFVALPGYSEHGSPLRPAVDFINEHGINGEDHPEEFEALPEYTWLMEHAKQFGFYLSYPRNNPSHTAYEPWHWHFEKQP